MIDILSVIISLGINYSYNKRYKYTIGVNYALFNSIQYKEEGLNIQSFILLELISDNTPEWLILPYQ